MIFFKLDKQHTCNSIINRPTTKKTANQIEQERVTNAFYITGKRSCQQSLERFSLSLSVCFVYVSSPLGWDMWHLVLGHCPKIQRGGRGGRGWAIIKIDPKPLCPATLALILQKGCSTSRPGQPGFWGGGLWGPKKVVCRYKPSISPSSLLGGSLFITADRYHC